MATVVNNTVVDRVDLPSLLAPRADVVTERPEADGSFTSAAGPFTEYRRTIEVSDVEGRPDLASVEEITRFRTAVPVWGLLFVPLFKRAMRRTAGRQDHHYPFWAPPDLMDARAATVLGLLCTASLVAGYLGTVITQTITYAAEQFDSSKSDQANTLSNVRVGVLLALVLVALADRFGRRKLLLASAVAACIATVAGAASTSLTVLGLTQVVATGFNATLILLVTIVAAEEMPAGSRAYAVSVMTMTGALGAGMCLWALPLADTSESGWRVLYVIPLLGLPVMLHVGRRLTESRRFASPHSDATVVQGHARRFWVLGVSLFLISMFGAPATQLLNEFLRSERGFSASRISLFTVLTSTPGAIGLVVGGRMADVRGRRIVVAVGVAGGTVLVALSFASHGWPMWAWSLVGTILAAAASPALAMYGPELFPTGSRGRANGVIRVISVAGSFVGLRIAGRIADDSSLSRAMTLLAAGPLLVGLLVWTMFPETAHKELEDLNPEDLPTLPTTPL